MTIKHIDLTDEEWMSLISIDRDGLPMCCGNVSVFRDVLIDAARNGGDVLSPELFVRLVGPALSCYDYRSPAVRKVLDQLGIVESV